MSAEPPKASSAKPKKGTRGKSDKKPGASLLSFDDEETEADAFQVKKKSSGNKKSMAAPDAFMMRDDGGGASHGDPKKSAVGGEYTIDRLRELASSQKSFGARPVEHLDPSAPAVFKFSGSDTAAGGEFGALDPVAFVPPPPPRKKPVASEDVAIPDAASIKAAKAKREQMRTGGSAAPDYIPVSGSEHLEELAARRGGGGGGRGVDCRGESDGEQDENVRVKFGVGGESAGGKGVFQAMVVDHAGDDKDDLNWEDEQLKRVMGGGGRVRAAKKAPASVSANGERALASLRAGLSRADGSRRAALDELKRADESLASSDAALKSHEERLATAGERYKFVQELKHYFRDLCACLKDKAPIIEELEEHVQRLHEQRAAAATAASEGEAQDEAAEAEAAVEAAQAALMRGESSAEAVATSTAAAEFAATARFTGTQKLDEFGRDLNLANRVAAEKRTTARRARRAAEEAASGDATFAHAPILGEADDIEDPGEVELFYKGWQDAREAGSCVLRDAGADFASIAPVKAKSEQWKKRFPKTYQDAYMAASTPQLFAPFVRLELLSWSPLYAPSSESSSGEPASPIDGMSWYSELFDYGMGGSSIEDDEDANLVPTIMEKLLVPIIEHAVKECWDATSVEQSNRIVAVVKELLVYLEPSSCEPMAKLLAVAKSKLHEVAMKRCSIPSWAPVVTASAPIAEMYARRRLGAALRCARAAVAWEGALPTRDVKSAVCDGIIAQHVAPHLRLLLARPGDCLAVIERTLAVLPREWVVGNAVASVRSVASTLGQMVRSQPESHGAAAAAAADARGKAVDPQRLVAVLAALGDKSEAQTVAELFGIATVL